MNYEHFSKIPYEVKALDIWMKKPFDKAHALIDIILNSCDYSSGGYEKGKVYRSKRWFAARWGWDRKTVDRFLADLEQKGVLIVDGAKKGAKKGATLTLAGKGKTANIGATKRAKNGPHSRINKEGEGELNSPPPPEEWEDWQ